MIEVALFIAFLLIAAGDCYSTAKILRLNHKLLTDKNFKRRYYYKLSKKLKEDEANAEMSNFGKRIIQKYGGDRAMLYIFIFGYQPLGLFLFANMLYGDESGTLLTIALVFFMFGILYGQIWKALTLKKRFGIEI